MEKVRDGRPGSGLDRGLARLPKRQRTAVVLHHAAGYPSREIAQIIETTPAVHVLLSRARKRLRELLGADDA
jgi:RNA polymerase sigma factor (sigma-70 family)